MPTSEASLDWLRGYFYLSDLVASIAKATVVVKLFGRLGKFYQITLGDDSQVMPAIMQSWTRIYTAFIRRRFVGASRGDGTWPPLAESTIRRRRRQSDVILRDTGLLFSQLAPEFVSLAPYTQPSAYKFEAVASFGGTGRYPDGVSTTEVLMFHQLGGGRLPQRKILVDADERTREQMRRAADRLIEEYLRDDSDAADEQTLWTS